MPRRLGDDPLTRARAERAKAAGASASAAPEPGSPQGSAQVGVQTSRDSYNDVFFQRRGDGSEFQGIEPRAPEAPEAPEISEISEIPEIREVAAVAGAEAAVEVTTEPRTGAVATFDAQAASAPGVPIVEEAVARNAAPPSVAAPADVTQVKEEPAAAQVAAPAPADSADGPKGEPQKGGFFKRLFGKLR